ncbi:MAG: CRTAC1 family protein, partial [Gemmatimonadaceae bacterium]
ARLYSLTNRPAEARATLEEMRRRTPGNARILYALAELEARQPDAAAAQRAEALLREALAAAPANLAVRLRLAGLLARRDEGDSPPRHLEEVRRLPPEPPEEVRAALDSSIALFRAGDLARARPALDRVVALLEVTSPFQASLEEVRWVEGPIPGRLVLGFAPKDFVTLRQVRGQGTPEVVRFTDATSEAGFEPAGARGSAADTARGPTALAAGDVDGDGADDLFTSSWSATQARAVARLHRVRGGFVRDVSDRSGIALPQGASFATFADFDNDGWLDLFAIGGDGRARLFRNRGDGTFEDATARARIADAAGARRALFADLDHDGDLDMLLVGDAGTRIYRNNLDGTFAEATAAFGLGQGGASDAAIGDFDDDGRIDLVTAGARGAALYRNGGATRLADATAARGLGGSAASAVTVGDYDNDGALDLFVGGPGGGDPALWRNAARGAFARDDRSAAALRALRFVAVTSASFLDYDNDGWLDLVVAGTPAGRGPASRGIFLFRNDGAGRLVDRSSILPEAARSAGASAVAVSDVDDDGDLDLVLVDADGAPRLLRNDFGNGSLAAKVELKALRDGSGKNNAFGIGSRVELRAGDIYQTRVVTGRVTHFGLGPHLKADVLRVEWPNGVPQTVYVPGSDQDVVERELLKGSCAFAYTWDGTRFRFVTDVMWRSALGMPLGLMGSSSAFAPAGASQEYIRIDGSALKPKDGRYVIQFTEELWETAYADEIKLLAVDHPDSVDVFVDERFVPPGPVSLRPFQVARPQLPRSATDEHGHDVLPALRAADDVYVSDFTPTRYQGVVEPHELVLDLGPDAGAPGTFLFLRGWIYPTDASINVALSQQTAIAAAPPSVEVRDARGRWVTAVPSIGFPSGKDKTVVVDLAGIFPTADRHVRLRTAMQIYWDHAFVARHEAASPLKVTALAPVSADLHFRGFSRTYRRGGRHGPFWFDYADVTRENPWRPIEGALTRFGDVLPLLGRADDMYVVMGPGDEATVQFDATSAGELKAGWKRTFLLYTDGWIKDSDLNTAHGTTVEPLPFHAIRSYPYSPGEAYPSDAAHQRYLREYNTRVVRGRARRERIAAGGR